MTAAVIQVVALGTPINLNFTVADSALISQVRKIWHFCIPNQPQPTKHEITVSLTSVDPKKFSAGVVASRNPAELLTLLTQEITRTAIQSRRGDLLMLHAVGLVAANGLGIAMVAQGGTGKTTIAKTLGPEYRYLSDETVACDLAGNLISYPKPLSIRDPLHEFKVETDPRDLGLSPCTEPARLTAILVLNRDPGFTGEPFYTDLDSFNLITQITPETSSLSALPKPLHFLQNIINNCSSTGVINYAKF